jgi:hypothetical protein
VFKDIYIKAHYHQNAERIFSYNIQDCLPCGSVDFTASTVLQDIRGSSLQLHALRLVAAANSTLAGFRYHFK